MPNVILPDGCLFGQWPSGARRSLPLLYLFLLGQRTAQASQPQQTQMAALEQGFSFQTQLRHLQHLVRQIVHGNGREAATGSTLCT